jgi:hypothetical protein
MSKRSMLNGAEMASSSLEGGGRPAEVVKAALGDPGAIVGKFLGCTLPGKRMG